MGGTTKYPAKKQNASYVVSGLAAYEVRRNGAWGGVTTTYPAEKNASYFVSGLAVVDDETVAPKFPVKFSGKRCFFLGQQVPHSLQVVHETQLGVVEPAKGLVVFERLR